MIEIQVHVIVKSVLQYVPIVLLFLVSSLQVDPKKKENQYTKVNANGTYTRTWLYFYYTKDVTSAIVHSYTFLGIKPEVFLPGHDAVSLSAFPIRPKTHIQQ